LQPGQGFADYLLYLIGPTATPNKQTFGFFHQNLVMEYPYLQAVADGFNSYFPRIAVTMGEAGIGGHPVNVRPAERARHGWQALDFRAERDTRAKKVIATGTDIKPV
jgi:type I restriction enzyme R subunit